MGSFTEEQHKRMRLICNSPRLALLKATRNSDGTTTAILCGRIDGPDGQVDYYPLAEIPEGDLGTLYTPEMEHTSKEQEIDVDTLELVGEAIVTTPRDPVTLPGEFEHVEKSEGQEG